MFMQILSSSYEELQEVVEEAVVIDDNTYTSTSQQQVDYTQVPNIYVFR